MIIMVIMIMLDTFAFSISSFLSWWVPALSAFSIATATAHHTSEEPASMLRSQTNIDQPPRLGLPHHCHTPSKWTPQRVEAFGLEGKVKLLVIQQLHRWQLEATEHSIGALPMSRLRPCGPANKGQAALLYLETSGDI